MIPIDIFEVQVILALICTGYSWWIHDQNNYTDTIAGVVATIFWWTSGLSLLSGVASDGVVYAGSWLTWIFIGIGLVTAFITFVKILDVLQKRGDHVDMSFDYRV